MLRCRRICPTPAAEPTGYVPAARVTPDGKDVITSEVQNVHTSTGRFDVVARVMELSASTGRPLRVLYTTTVDHATGGAAARSACWTRDATSCRSGPK